MKILNLILILALFPVTLFGQEVPISELKRQIEESKAKIKKSELIINENKESRDKLHAQLMESHEETNQFWDQYNGIDEKKTKALEDLKKLFEIEWEDSKASLKQQLKITKDSDRRSYRSFLRCIKKGLAYGIRNAEQSLKKCKTEKGSYNPIFTERFKKQSAIFTTPTAVLREKWSKSLANTRALSDQHSLAAKAVYNAESEILSSKKNILDNTKKVNDINFSKKFANLLSCSSNSPTIDLEEETIMKGSMTKGPFYKIPRDHQDFIGTCYANTAKNLLLGITGGKDNISFLDAALQYKAQTETNLTELDGGNACTTIDELKKSGYCPKEFSPIESGDDTQMENGIFNKNNSLGSQAYLLSLIGNYLNGKSLLEKNTDIVSKNFIKNTKRILMALKEDKNIKLPMPHLETFPIDKNEIQQQYLWNYKKFIEEKNKTGGNLPIVSESDFKNEYETKLRNFTNEYIQEEETGSTPAKRRALYKKHFAEFNKKYHLEDRVYGTPFSNMFDSFFEKNISKSFKNEIDSTLKFYREVIDSDLTRSGMFDLYNVKCIASPEKLERFTDGLRSLIELFNHSQMDIDNLYDENGNHISNKDFLQLATTPKCINPKNRKKISTQFTCDVRYTSEYDSGKKQSGMRKDILKSLAKGIPAGNSFAMVGGNHINTIVGYRFNPESKRCEFKIRESQTASFFWQDENDLTNQAFAITIVDKED